MAEQDRQVQKVQAPTLLPPSPLKFEEKHEKYSASGFACTNEEHLIFRQLLRNRKFEKAGVIASGGEMLFFLFLPQCQEIVAVDHSYNSLIACALKALLLQSLGAKGLRDLFMCKDQGKVREAIAKVRPLLPEVLRDKEPKKDITGYQIDPSIDQNLHELRKEWFLAPILRLEKARKNLDRVTLVHGDLRDIEGRGPFDLFYLSNALQHVGRAGAPKLDSIIPMIRVGGYLLVTGGINYPPKNREVEGVKHPSLKLINSLDGIYSSWRHALYQRVEKKVGEKVKGVAA